VTEEETTTSAVVSASEAATVSPTTATVNIVTICQPLRPLEGDSAAARGPTSLTSIRSVYRVVTGPWGLGYVAGA
jgi:hypothetical protein